MIDNMDLWFFYLLGSSGKVCAGGLIGGISTGGEVDLLGVGRLEHSFDATDVVGV
jgi:hypothetical protein